MQKRLFLLVVMSGLFACKPRLATSESLADPSAGSQWTYEDIVYKTNILLVKHELKIRTGTLPAAGGAAKGSVLFLEGLGDSFRNHSPFFNALAQAGYQVIAFDYMGQGGSEGTMNHTRILDKMNPELQVSKIAEIVWTKYSKTPQAPIVIGWSTGGLAAYEMAFRKWAQKVILIAPGICPKLDVGAGFIHGDKITLATLTSDAKSYSGNAKADPHIDPIKPTSPLLVPAFATNLAFVGKGTAKGWIIPPTVKGFVALSGPNDNYVNASCAKEVLGKNAKHFEVREYKDALHEIDNETVAIRTAFYADVIAFLAR